MFDCNYFYFQTNDKENTCYTGWQPLQLFQQHPTQSNDTIAKYIPLYSQFSSILEPRPLQVSPVLQVDGLSQHVNSQSFWFVFLLCKKYFWILPQNK